MGTPAGGEFERLVAYAQKVAKSSRAAQGKLTSTSRRSTESKRLFGLRTETSWIDEAVVRLTGWSLWRQHIGERMIVGDLNTRNVLVDEKETYEIWLGSEGRLWFARCEQRYFVPESRTEVSVSLGEATPEQLRYPDYQWNIYRHKADKRFAIDKEAHWNQGEERFDRPFLGVSLALNRLTK